MRCERCFDSFCMIFAKFIVAKKFLHEKSVKRSISSSRLSPFGSVVTLIMVCLGALIISSSGRVWCGFAEKCSWQKRKKLNNGNQ